MERSQHNMSNKQYPQIAYMNGHKGIHIKDGIYKLEQPLRINRNAWIHNKEYADYVVAPNNYSSDLRECDIIYFTNINSYGLSNMIIEINNDNHNDDFGYLQNLYTNRHTELLGGRLEVEI